jgi:hypothetical protein
MEIINFDYWLTRDKGTITAAEINPATDLIIIGKNIAGEGQTPKYVTKVMTIEDLIALINA